MSIDNIKHRWVWGDGTSVTDLFGYLKKVIGSGYRSSAISPLLWLNALVTPLCLLGSFWIDSNFRWAPFTIAVVLIFFTLLKYHSLVKENPKLVQSESFQLESQKLDIIAKKGGDILVNPVHIPLSQEPRRLQFDSSEEHR